MQLRDAVKTYPILLPRSAQRHYILCPWEFGTLWIDPKTSKIGRNGALDLVILH